MDSVGPSLKFWLMSFIMPTDKFDPAYKHLGMVLSKAGYAIQPGHVVYNRASHPDEWSRWLRNGPDCESFDG